MSAQTNIEKYLSFRRGAKKAEEALKRAGISIRPGIFLPLLKYGVHFTVSLSRVAFIPVGCKK